MAEFTVGDRVRSAVDSITDRPYVLFSAGGDEGPNTLLWWSEDQLSIEVDPAGDIYIHKADLGAGTWTDATLRPDADLAAELAPWFS